MHNTTPKLLTCTGYGFTGSSAGTNILEEFQTVKSLGDKFECAFLHEADGMIWEWVKWRK
jgi:hypothetical protein